MFGDSTLFESCMRDFEAIENDPKKNVDEDIRRDVAYKEDFVEWFLEGWNALSPDEKEERLGEEARDLVYNFEDAQHQLRHFFDEDYVKWLYQRFTRGKAFESKQFTGQILESIEQVIIGNIDRDRLATVCDELGYPEDVVIQAILGNYEYNLSQSVDMGALDEWLDENLVASVIKDSIPDPAVEEEPRVQPTLPPEAREESKVDEDFEEFKGRGIEIGDTIQVMDLEGNTTIVLEATVHAMDEALGDDGEMHLTIETTGSKNEDKQEWYREDQYDIVLLKKNETKTEQGELMTASTDSHFESLVDRFSQVEKDENKNVDESQLKEGQFSWHASDTDEPIYSTEGHQETIFMIDDKGNKWQESAYEGYGVFGGKDFYELLAEMNGLASDRQLGIDLAFKGNAGGDDTEGVKYPKLVSDPDANYEDVSNPRSHENQGWWEEEGEDEHGYGSPWDDDDDDDFEDDNDFDEAKDEYTTYLEDLTPYELMCAEEQCLKDIRDAEDERDSKRVSSLEDQLRKIQRRSTELEQTWKNEKKAVPVCGKCSKKHWPFKKCSEAEEISEEEISKEDVPDEVNVFVDKYEIARMYEMYRGVHKGQLSIEQFAKLCVDNIVERYLSSEYIKEDDIEHFVDLPYEQENEELTSRVDCKGCGEPFDATGEEEYCSDFCKGKEVDEAKTFTCNGCREKLPISKLSLSKGNKNYCPKCRGKA